MSVLDATEAAIGAAAHLTPLDAGALEALRVLAQKIDTDDELRAAYLDDAVNRKVTEGVERRPLQLDNVSIPTYLKFCESLGLTPAGRKRLDEKKESGGGKLAQLRAVDGGQSKRRGPRAAG